MNIIYLNLFFFLLGVYFFLFLEQIETWWDANFVIQIDDMRRAYMLSILLWKLVHNNTTASIISYPNLELLYDYDQMILANNFVWS